jgi:hypothetical protein
MVNGGCSTMTVAPGARPSFHLRRVAFPARPTPEWFVVDLFEDAATVGVSLGTLSSSLAQLVV